MRTTASFLCLELVQGRTHNNSSSVVFVTRNAGILMESCRSVMYTNTLRQEKHESKMLRLTQIKYVYGTLWRLINLSVMQSSDILFLLDLIDSLICERTNQREECRVSSYVATISSCNQSVRNHASSDPWCNRCGTAPMKTLLLRIENSVGRVCLNRSNAKRSLPL